MTVIEVKNLKKYFPIKTGLFKQKSFFKAVDDVSFKINQHKVHALVGESGCGKTTISRMLLRLIHKTNGDILFKGREIFDLKGAELKAYRRAVQIVFQDPYASLNPRMKILNTLSEPLVVHNISNKKDYLDIVKHAVNRVGLDSDVLTRYPHEFSGGQRQRICIARALMLSPELIVADEPLSSLDVSIQAQILNLLKGLMDDEKLSLFLISHDLNVVRYLSDEITVMYLGKIVEQANTVELFNKPLHPYTQMLIDAAPKISNIKKKYIQTTETIPSKEATIYSCPLLPRCSKNIDICSKIAPALIKYDGRLVSCHLYNKS
ncbi:MAG: ATP-binding cassette domain-containing protein [Nitrospirae bacterium]|nr:ATP-binding cassette domain-containing protein [Nitrospirota bacterium]MBF0540719.1 ATP-binding cassette domain-containing protein [Nitrospirota bacterium]